MGTTHKEIETLCDNFMKEQGWKRVRRPGKKNPFPFRWRPDRVYTKEDQLPLVFEIKPGNASEGEIQRGIGQAVSYLPYQVKPYLVLEEKHCVGENWAIFQLLPIGILAYTEDGKKIYMRKGGIVRPLEGLLPLIIEKEKKLTKKLLIAFLKEHFHPGEKEEYYPLSGIVNGLLAAYPGTPIYPTVTGKMLLSLGFGRARLDPQTLKYASDGKTYFLINLRWWEK